CCCCCCCCCCCQESREARQAGRVQPRRGGAHGCAPFSEQQDAASENSRPACEPNGFIVGRAVRAAFFWLLFFAVQRKVTPAAARTALVYLRAKSDPRLRGDDGEERSPPARG